MANRVDFFPGQTVTADELDLANAFLELAIHRLAIDWGLVGIASGLELSEQSPAALTMDLSAGVAYDPAGQRISVLTTLEVDCSQNVEGESTEVLTVGNSRWVTVVARFTRNYDDDRDVEGLGIVSFQALEDYTIVVLRGAEAVSPTKPAVLANDIVIADLIRLFGQVDFDDADIDLSRRSNFLSAGPSREIAWPVMAATAVVDALTVPVRTVGQVGFDASKYPGRTLRLQGVGQVDNGSLTGVVRLRNMDQAGEVVGTFSFAGDTTPTRGSVALTVADSAGNVRPYVQTYAVEIEVTGGSLATDIFTASGLNIVVE